MCGTSSGGARTRRARRGRRRAGGFTLLEVIVAFTILSVALAGLLQAFATGMGSLDAARASAAAVMHARSKLDQVGLSLPLEEGEQAGEFADGYVWRVRVARAAEAENIDNVKPIAIAYRVEVEVSGPRGGALKLTTLRLGAAQ